MTGNLDVQKVRPAGKALRAIQAAGRTVAERVKACHAAAGGIQVELNLDSGLPVTDVQSEIGPYDSVSNRMYHHHNKQISFYRDGKLETRIDGGEAVVIAVNP